MRSSKILSRASHETSLAVLASAAHILKNWNETNLTEVREDRYSGKDKGQNEGIQNEHRHG